ncbi:MAG: DMT family transporter [Anaerolineae bacterium]
MSEQSVGAKWRWYLAAFAATFIMATLGVFVREVSPGNELVVALGRFGIGFVCLAGLAALKRGDPTPPARVTGALVASGVCLALFVVFYFKAVLSGPLANAAFLLYLGPLVASTLAALWLGEGFNRMSGVLLGGALLGTLFITEFRIPDSADQVESLVFGVLSGVFYGLFLLLNNPKLQGAGSSYARTRYQFLFATLALVPVVALDGVSLRLADLPWIIAVGVLHGFVALTLVVASLGYLRTIEYGTISYGEPVMAALLGVVLYSESISLLQVVGCLFVLVAGIARVFLREQAPVPTRTGL